jgi:hypothetical protein
MSRDGWGILRAAAFTLVVGCGARQPAARTGDAAEEPAATRSFLLSREALSRGGASPELIAKLEKSRFRYFRMLAEPFESRVCSAFGERSTSLPVTALHGDAHLEQFVVTRDTYGLEDLDRSGFGPAVVDLVRYAASLHVACAEVSFPCDGDAAVTRFLAAWRSSLERQPAPGPEPAVVPRLRAKVPASRKDWLTWADQLMAPLAAEEDAAARREWATFGKAMRRMQPGRPPEALAVVRLGSLSMGFGSALERKTLIRVAGPTAADEDDLIIEAREGSAPRRESCVWRATYGESMILMFTALLSRRMPDIHGFVPLFGGTKRFWIQSWDPGYQEVGLRDVRSQAELEELAEDAAEQLAGHLWTKFPEPLLPYQAYAQLEAFEATREDVSRLARDLANESNGAWERFRLR